MTQIKKQILEAKYKPKSVDMLDPGEYFWFQKDYCRMRIKSDETVRVANLTTKEEMELHPYWKVNHAIDTGDESAVPNFTPEEEQILVAKIKNHGPTDNFKFKVTNEELRTIQLT